LGGFNNGGRLTIHLTISSETGLHRGENDVEGREYGYAFVALEAGMG
jgi:hypothetical protein